MKTTSKRRVIRAETIAKQAERGEDVSHHFTGKGKMMPPIQRVNVDFALEMLVELDEAAKRLNISRQAVIKGFVRQALDQHYLASRARKAG
jgi:hypothetical protein